MYMYVYYFLLISGNFQAAKSFLNNQTTNKKTQARTPYDPENILPGFMLVVGVNEDGQELSTLERSCSLCNITKPLIKFNNLNSSIV